VTRRPDTATATRGPGTFDTDSERARTVGEAAHGRPERPRRGERVEQVGERPRVIVALALPGLGAEQVETTRIVGFVQTQVDVDERVAVARGGGILSRLVQAHGNLGVQVRQVPARDEHAAHRPADDREQHVVDGRVVGPGGADRVGLAQRHVSEGQCPPRRDRSIERRP
jgi:hypothetical protein